MGRGRAVRATLVIVAVTAGLLLPGCSLSEQSVLVVGRDDAGTLVVAAGSCDRDVMTPAEDISIWDASDPFSDADLWSIELAGGPHAMAESPPPEPPAPDPGAIDRLPLIAVGTTDPDGYTVVEPLRQPLPSQPLEVEALVDTDEYDDDFLDARVSTVGEPDSYTVVLGDQTVSDLDADEAAERVAEHCADDGSDQLSAGLWTGGMGGVVVTILLVVALVIAGRQYRRAGLAAQRRRAGLPPAG